MAALQNTVANLQGKIKNLKVKLNQSSKTSTGGNTAKWNTKREYNPHPTWFIIPYWCNYRARSHDVEICYIRTVVYMKKYTVLNRMKFSKRGLPSNAWQLGTNTVSKMIKSSYILNDHNVVKILTFSTIKCNIFRRNPHNHNQTYIIADTGAMQNCIKYHTPWKKSSYLHSNPSTLPIWNIYEG